MSIIAFIIGAILLGTGPVGWVILLFGLFCYGDSWLINDIDESDTSQEVVEPEYQLYGRSVSYQSYLYGTPYEELSPEDQEAKRELEVRYAINMRL